MPLFGSKHKHEKEEASSKHHAMGPSSAYPTDHTNTQVLKGDHVGVPTAVGSGAGPGASVNPGLLTGQPAAMAEGYSRHDHTMGGRHGTHGMTDTTATGMHGTTGMHGATGTGMHGTGMHGTTGNTSHSSGGGKTSMTGKIESALGSAFNSESLKMKGLEKQREAELLNKQGSELAEAEILEREAAMHRERAEGMVTHGGRMDDLHRGGRQPY